MADINYPPADEFVYDEPERTSILAILSLIASLICFIPLIGVIGIFLGIFALVGIGSSKGRVKGTGLAVAGIVIGLIFSTIWIGVGFAVQGGLSQFPQLASVMVDVESGTPDEIRAKLSSDVHAAASDEAIAQFRDAYQAELGSFQEIPSGIAGIITAYTEIGPTMNRINDPSMPYQGQMIPVPGEFDNGLALIMLAFNAQAQSNGGSGAPMYSNVGIMTADGATFWLYDPATPIGLPSGGDGSDVPELGGDASDDEPAADDASGESG